MNYFEDEKPATDQAQNNESEEIKFVDRFGLSASLLIKLHYRSIELKKVELACICEHFLSRDYIFVVEGVGGLQDQSRSVIG